LQQIHVYQNVSSVPDKAKWNRQLLIDVNCDVRSSL
jgi:hypothetical protein